MLFRFTRFTFLTFGLACLYSGIARAGEVYYLKKVVIADTADKAAQLPATDGGDQKVVVHDDSPLTNTDFAPIVEEFIGRPIDSDVLTSLVNAILDYARNHGFSDAQIVIPNGQSIAAGTLRIAVVLPHLNQAAAEKDKTYSLSKLILSDSVRSVTAIPDDTDGERGVVVRNVQFLSTPDFRLAMHKFIGRPITNELLHELVAAIIQYARTHDRIITQVTPPPTQNVEHGVLRLAVLVGRYNQFVFKGNRWFSRKLLEQKFGIKPGDEVRESVLEDAVTWANANPFRQVKVVVNNLADQPGKADLIVSVNDVRPLRFFGAYNNDGAPLLGRNQYSGSIQFGDLWGADHEASYQYVRTDSAHLFQAHTIDYLAPLPWRHYLQLSASYSLVHPRFYDGLIEQKGEDLAADLRYKIPFGKAGNNGELFFGIDFKDSNNNLQYGGTDVSAAKIDIFDAVVGFSAVRRDTKGAWQFGASLNLSPGNINSRNTDAAFQPGFRNGTYHVGRLGARARYATATLSLQRLTDLAQGWQMFSRVTAQLATANLVSNEQLSIGGVNTVRGVNPNVFSGEQGFVVDNDLLSPAWKHVFSFLPKKANEASARFSVFYDAAQVFYKHHFPVVDFSGRQIGWDDDVLRPLAGAGLGLRIAIANNFNLSFDYGWQVTHPQPPIDGHGRGHIKAVLSF